MGLSNSESLGIPHLIGGPVFTIVLARRVGHVHKQVMALIEIALCQANANRKCNPLIRPHVCDLIPVGETAALLVDHMWNRGG